MLSRLIVAPAPRIRTGAFYVMQRLSIQELFRRGNAPLIQIVARYLMTSQLPVERWYEVIGNPTLADAILDRLVHNAYRLDLTGESLRKTRSLEPAT
jgi:hypothetical protein